MNCYSDKYKRVWFNLKQSHEAAQETTTTLKKLNAAPAPPYQWPANHNWTMVCLTSWMGMVKFLEWKPWGGWQTLWWLCFGRFKSHFGLIKLFHRKEKGIMTWKSEQNDFIECWKKNEVTAGLLYLIRNCSLTERNIKVWSAGQVMFWKYLARLVAQILRRSWSISDAPLFFLTKSVQ